MALQLILLTIWTLDSYKELIEALHLLMQVKLADTSLQICFYGAYWDMLNMDMEIELHVLWIGFASAKHTIVVCAIESI